MMPLLPKKDWGLQFMKCLYDRAWSEVSLLPPVLSQGSDPSGLWLSYDAIAAATRSEINASRASVSKTGGMPEPGSGSKFNRLFASHHAWFA
jgi:hypothetical protein